MSTPHFTRSTKLYRENLKNYVYILVVAWYFYTESTSKVISGQIGNHIIILYSAQLQHVCDIDPESFVCVCVCVCVRVRACMHTCVCAEEGGEVVGIVDSQNRQTVLVGLTPDTLYAITVRAYNKHGASPSSHPIYIRTDLTGELCSSQGVLHQ